MAALQPDARAEPGLLAPQVDLATPPSPSKLAVITRSLDVYIPAAVVLFLLAADFLWPLVYPVPPPVGGSILDSSLGIGAPGHILGTSTVGNDIMSRLLYGGRVSFEVAGATQFIGVAVGSAIGIVSTFVGGVTEAIVQRLLDVLIALPGFVLALAILDGLGPGELNIIWALSIAFIPVFARLSRAATLRLREQTFVVAATLTGTKRRRTILRHLLPNVLPQLFTLALLNAGIAIIIAATLSYFGFGVPPPGPSLGNMIASGQAVMSTQPALLLVPSIVLLLMVVSLNMLGDGLRARWGVQ